MSLVEPLTLAAARRRVAALADLKAFISLTDERGEGTVVAVKDLVDVRGSVTTGGGTHLPTAPAAHDAAVVRRLRPFGVVVIGKTNLAEYALGVTSENAHFGTVRNFHDPSRVAGGSSGGSAVAVAAGMCEWSIGTDTGGSIRIPAALNGVVGIKPTYGLIDTDGVLPLSPSLDTVGPMAMDVGTVARALEQMSGLSFPTGASGLSQYKLGFPSGWIDDLDVTTAAAWRLVSGSLVELAFPDRTAMANAQVTILQAEATHLHLDWMARSPERYGQDVLQKLEAGRRVTAVEYLAAKRDQERHTAGANQALSDIDAMLLPVSPIVAPPIGGPDPVATLTRFTKPFSLTGQPTITIPAPSRGMPVGVQVVGRSGDDASVLRIARALEDEWKNAAVGEE